MARRQYNYLEMSSYRSLGTLGSDSALLHVRCPCCKSYWSQRSAQIEPYAHNMLIVWYRWSWCTSVYSFCSGLCDPHILRNKWVLNSTTTPLFFLFAQLLIAVVLFVIANAVGIFKVPLKPDTRKCKGLMPMVLINVVGLRRVLVLLFRYFNVLRRFFFSHSSNNYCLKYVDASFYQIARGLVLPLTVFFSVFFLRNTRPSIRIFVACGVVTVGFFVGVFLDGSYNSRTDGKGPSFLGIFFGILSSMTTAAHAVVIKKSLEVVNGDAIELSWYSNVLSSVLLLPLILLAGEGPDILAFINTPDFSATGNSALTTFLWGSLITVSLVLAFARREYALTRSSRESSAGCLA